MIEDLEQVKEQLYSRGDIDTVESSASQQNPPSISIPKSVAINYSNSFSFSGECAFTFLLASCCIYFTVLPGEQIVPCLLC